MPEQELTIINPIPEHVNALKRRSSPFDRYDFYWMCLRDYAERNVMQPECAGRIENFIESDPDNFVS